MLDVATRRADLARHPVLADLAGRIKARLAPLLERPLFLPEEKALLSRDGGVCASDGARLMFRPLEPWRHQCPRCGATYEGERHHRWWITRYHIWLSERAIHAALLGGLLNDATLRSNASGILSAYAARYPAYPNQDNVLGPTRLFFSTYLESLWLTQIVIAALLLEADPGATREAQAARRALAPVVAESSGIIAEFDEAFSNRQVWNNAALAAAGRFLDDAALTTRALDGPHGLRAQLDGAVSAEGMWWEGENYHFFALRGFVLAAELLRGAGVDLYADQRVGERLSLMFEAPLRALLPDRTLPARGDAPYGVSILQPRFAELWEVGWARTNRDAIARVLADGYAADAPERDDPGVEEIAEQEQNRPPQRLSRQLLGWKSLAWMNPAAPVSAASPGTTLEHWDDLGLSVLRDGARYIGVECGPTLAGHGHPDVLHLSLADGGARFADFGTGSYVAPSLAWYRSTLAHNAPGIAGEGQRPGVAWCDALDEQKGWRWVRAFARGVLGPGTVAVRSVIAGPEYVADVVEVNVPPDLAIDLPLHPVGPLVLDAASPPVAWPGPVGAGGHEHGYDRVRDLSLITDAATPFHVTHGDSPWRIVLAPRESETVFAGRAPGPPDLALADTTPLAFLVRHAEGSGTWAQVYAAEAAGVTAARFERGTLEVERDGLVDVIQLSPRGVRIKAGKADIRLAGLRPAPTITDEPEGLPGGPLITATRVAAPPAPGDWAPFPAQAIVTLGDAAYRRSETPYGATPFGARVAAFATREALGFALEVRKPDLVVRAADAPNPALDNESPDIHSDGVQCYLDAGEGWWGFVALPAPDGSLRVSAVAGTGADPARASGSWRRTPEGYALVIAVRVDQPLEAGDQVPVNLVVNEMRPGRERRAGQLVLSGGGGWVYLRGDREPVSDAAVAEVA